MPRLFPSAGRLAAAEPPLERIARPTGRKIAGACRVGCFSPIPSRPLSPPGQGGARGLRPPLRWGRGMQTLLPLQKRCRVSQGCPCAVDPAPLRLRRVIKGRGCQKSLDFRTIVWYDVLARPVPAVIIDRHTHGAAKQRSLRRPPLFFYGQTTPRTGDCKTARHLRFGAECLFFVHERNKTSVILLRSENSL